MSSIEGMQEHCDVCSTELEAGQIGKCDDCQPEGRANRYTDAQLGAVLEALLRRLTLSALKDIVAASSQCWDEQLNGNRGSQREASEAMSLAICRGVAGMISHDKEIAARLIDQALR